VNCEQVIESGAYVLGILEPDEHRAYERHLKTCGACRAEVADFAGLPDILGQLDPDLAAAVGEPFYEPPDEVRYEAKDRAPLRPLPSVPRANPVEEFVSRGAATSSRVARGAQRRQRRWRAVTAGLAAAACLAVGIVVGTRVLDTSPPTPSDKNLVAMHAVADTVPITAQVALNPFIGGTAVRMHCVYNGGHPAPRWTLKLLVYPRDGGAPQQVSTWTAAHGDDLTLSAATSLPPDQISKVELRKADDTPLLVYDNA
jgi:hypothetical protein